ncbi:MAG: hypothetical protein EHM70_01870 [Chloroflexota bacterium]|nr:MAG: hypothetical protein EHM70_01870 [Chloroflexota bacterium]
MSVLQKIATFQGHRDEVPNQELARELAAAKDRQGVSEIAENLWNKDKNVQSDCLKVLYEIGYISPDLIAGYSADFLKLLRSKNNRLVWGAMIALSTIADLKADELFAHRAEIFKAMGKGSVITVDNGIKALALIASTNDEYRGEIFPYLLEHLKTCRPKEVPQHAEKIMVAVNAGNQAEFVQVLESRLDIMTKAQAARLNKLIRAAKKLS